MKLFLIPLILHLSFVYSDREKKLSDEEKNARCCARGLSCCRKAVEPTNFEVRALLTKCHREEEAGAASKTLPPTSARKRRVPEEGSKACHHEVQNGITNCKKKIKLTVKIKNTWITNLKNQYIIIDHVFDSVTNQKQKLLNPYVLKIRQEPVVQTYELGYESMVNSEAKEKVHNKKEQGYTGCSVNPSKNPTCGTMKYRNEVIPYSTGFCCSCDENNNNENKNHDGKMARNVSFSPDGIADTFKMSFPSGFSRKSRTSFNGAEETHNLQKRGGQDCNDKYTPPNADPNTYHDSTHCLEFSDLWYNVYQLEKPKLRHTITLQIYQKYQDFENSCKWRDLTKMQPIIVGTSSPGFLNDQGTVSVNYSTEETSDNLFSLQYKTQKLLIPDTSNVPDPNGTPELRGGPSEYLVIQDTQVEPTGKSCNTAGVGYEAFAKQPNRCSVSKGSCLENQPSQMWRQDHELEASGKRGKYFLKNFGVLPESPISQNDSSSQNKTLTMFFTDCHTSVLDVEIRADYNTVLRPSALAIITEVYVDSSAPEKTSIIAKVFNSGLVSGVFSVDLTNCPLDLPASFGNINSKPAFIPPQHQHIYKLDIVCPLPLTRFVCSLQVLNDKQELIALREIRLQKQDRCICVWHCSCACLLEDGGLRCSPMSLQAYYAAGFQGGMPQSLHVVQYTLLDDLVSMMLYILLFLCLTLMLMGLLKALLGVISVPIGLWGMDVILDLPKRMHKYYETEIDHRQVLYDGSGWPIHPDTKKRVRNIPLQAEFCINVIFFMVYPLALIWSMIRKKPSDSSDELICYCKDGGLVQRKSSGLQNSVVRKSSLQSIKK
ncbi:unnamed protein product [Phaedon cochleariae]|uniref:Generative cell specific-1/HAP2 domain-containing protein n=1 Tax=Phaedon cochleariae TaxID=80249 RepID=A0A9P0D8K5_PHACE|nr:unnamed protein product [Phaedon cochleariae]